MASIFKRGGHGPWQIAWFDASGKRRERSARTTCRQTAGQIAARLEADEALRRRGLLDPTQERFASERGRAIDAHLTDFLDGLAVGEKQRKVLKTRLLRVFALCNIESLADLTGSAVQAALAEVRKVVSVQTCNHYVRAVKQFSRWLWRDGRVAADPLAHLRTANAEADRRYSRRALQDDEAARLIDATARGPVVLGMAGVDRAMLYRVALGTGFRASELRSLTPGSFALGANPPTITVLGGYSKRRREDVQPIRSDLADMLQPWLDGKVKGVPAFGEMPGKTARMIHLDLRRARALWILESPNRRARRERRTSDFLAVRDDAGRVADFHALRHTYISRLVSSGASVKVCQELARHSTPILTIGRYAHARLFDLTQALDGLPGVDRKSESKDAGALLATGTYDAAKDPPQIPQQSGCDSQRRGAAQCETGTSVSAKARHRKPANLAGKSGNMRRGAAPCEKATGRIRTDDLRFTKPLLCQLSYGGDVRLA